MTERKILGRVGTTICGILLSLAGAGLSIHSCSNLPHPNTIQYAIKKQDLGEQILYMGGVAAGVITMGMGLSLVNKGLYAPRKRETNYTKK